MARGRNAARQGCWTTGHVDDMAARSGATSSFEQVGDYRASRRADDHLSDLGDRSDDVVIGDHVDRGLAPGIVRPAAPGDQLEVDGGNPHVRIARRGERRQRPNIGNRFRREQDVDRLMP